MEIGGVVTTGAINRDSILKWNIGERLLVEVTGKKDGGEGSIRVNGQTISALLETTVQIGDKLWVKVGEVKEGSLLLIREPSADIKTGLNSSPQLQQVSERGLPVNQELIAMVKTLPTANNGILSSLLANLQGTMTDELRLLIKKNSPEWKELSEKNGAEKLIACLRKLGINYENRVAQLLKLPSSAKEIEKNEIKDTLKFKLLEAIQGQEGDDGEGQITDFIRKITGQQLWFKTGALETAYMLLQLPIQNQGQLITAQIAIESGRKGIKMDEKHCRIALQIETEMLGEVGIDALFDNDSLNFCVLSRDQETLHQLIQEIMPETRTEFAKLGFVIGNVDTGDLDQSVEFQNFLKGSRRSGVDIQR